MKLICPKCELPMEDHENGCPKRLSRRFFLGALGSIIGSAALAKALPPQLPGIAKALEAITVTEAAGDSLIAVASPRVFQGRIHSAIQVIDQGVQFTVHSQDGFYNTDASRLTDIAGVERVHRTGARTIQVNYAGKVDKSAIKSAIHWRLTNENPLKEG